ncbi:MAG TPA: CopD family protein [Tepidisphaeraceae bacterium]|jgi:putative copper export protein
MQITGWLVAARAVHFGACLLAFGTVAFDRSIAAPVLNDQAATPVAIRWRRSVRRMVWWSLAMALASGAGWFALNAISMSGLSPREALQPDVLRVVLTDTHFGKLWELRGLVWVVTLVAIVMPRFAFRNLVLLLSSGAVAGSLAWAGHGTEGNAPNAHVMADVLHILIGGLWPAGLLPFALLLSQLRRAEPHWKWHAITTATRRFSAMSLTSVILLAGTGLINSLFLIGSPSDLVTTSYGKTLTAKVIAFLAMVALGALNLLRWKPRLSLTGDDQTTHATARLRLNVTLELALGAIVLLLVGLLGILPPAIDAITHAHDHH